MYISSSNEYPRFLGDILLEFPDFVEGDALPTGWHAVTPAEVPSVDFDFQLIYEEFPELIDGTYYQKLIVRDLTEEELASMAAQKVRIKVINNEPITAEEAALLVV